MSVFASTQCHRIFKSKNSSLLLLNLDNLSTNRVRALWGGSQEPLCSTSGLQFLTSHAFHQLLFVFIPNLCESGAVELIYRKCLWSAEKAMGSCLVAAEEDAVAVAVVVAVTEEEKTPKKRKTNNPKNPNPKT